MKRRKPSSSAVQEAATEEEYSTDEEDYATQKDNVPIKEESHSFGGGGLLALLAEVASEELKTNKSLAGISTRPIRRSCDEVEETKPPVTTIKKTSTGRQPRRLADHDFFTFAEVSHFSNPTLLRMFSDQDFNEMKRTYTYTCYLMPQSCSAKTTSFGNEAKAKTMMKDHLKKHLEDIVTGKNKDTFINYNFESILARKRRIEAAENEEEDIVSPQSSPQVVVKHEVSADTGEEAQAKPQTTEKENSTVAAAKKQKKGQAAAQQLLGDIYNEQRAVRSEEDWVKVERHEVVVKKEGGFVDDEDSRESGEFNDEVQVIENDHCYFMGSSRPPSRVEGEESFDDEDETLTDEEIENINGNLVDAVDLIEAVKNSTGSNESAPESALTGFLVQEALIPFAGDEEVVPPIGSEMEVVQLDEQAPESETLLKTSELRIIPSGKMKNRRGSPQGSDEERDAAMKALKGLQDRGTSTDDLTCRICKPAKDFTAYTTLLSHLRSHAGIRRYHCEHCDSTFTRQHSLNYHMLIHTNQTRFECTDCGRKFRHPSHFKEHKRRHTGEYPFDCDDCVVRFKTRNTYKRHLLINHGKRLTPDGVVLLSKEEYDQVGKETEGKKSKKLKSPEQPAAKRRKTGKKKKDGPSSADMSASSPDATSNEDSNNSGWVPSSNESSFQQSAIPEQESFEPPAAVESHVPEYSSLELVSPPDPPPTQQRFLVPVDNRQPQQYIFAEIDGKQVLLIPQQPAAQQQFDGGHQLMYNPVMAVSPPSKLEQCLRYGSASVAPSMQLVLPAATVSQSMEEDETPKFVVQTDGRHSHLGNREMIVSTP